MMYRISLFLVLFLLAACAKEENPPVNQIKHIQEMGQIGTVHYVVTKLVQANDEGEWYKFGDRKILMSVEADITAGVDLRKVAREHISIDGQTVSIALPPAEIITFNMDGGKVEVVYAKYDYFRSDFGNEERDQLLVQAERQIRGTIPQMNILATAEKNAIAFLESWLRLSGFDDIQIWIDR